MKNFELVNEEIFDDMSQAVAVMYWLVHLLGGEVNFPMDENFWLSNYPEGGTTRLVLRREGNSMVMSAETLKGVSDE